MSTKLYEWSDGITQLGSVWAGLVESTGINPSMHPGWLDISICTQGYANSARVLLVELGADVAIVPLVYRRVLVGGVPMRCLDLCTNVMSYHAELIASGSQERVLATVAQCKDIPRWDVLRLGNLVSPGSSVAAADVAGQSLAGVVTYAGEQSPFAGISQGWSALVAGLPKKMRANITRCVRTTEQAGTAGMDWYGKDGDVDRLLADMLEVESRSWKVAENKSIKANTPEAEYYRRLLPWLARHGLMANVLRVDNRPAAYVLCATWGGWAGQLKTSFAADVRDAGFRVIQASIERACDTGQREYDFLGDAAPHKLRWTSQIRAHEHKWLFARHWRGRALLQLKRTIDAWRYRQPADAQAGRDEE